MSWTKVEYTDQTIASSPRVALNQNEAVNIYYLTKWIKYILFLISLQKQMYGAEDLTSNNFCYWRDSFNRNVDIF